MYIQEAMMELKDFNEKEQAQIKAGLSEAVISDKETTDRIIALVPEEWVRKIPFFVRKHAITKTVEKIANEHPDLYAAARRKEGMPAKEKEELRQIITGIFEEKMNKHNIK